MVEKPWSCPNLRKFVIHTLDLWNKILCLLARSKHRQTVCPPSPISDQVRKRPQKPSCIPLHLRRRRIRGTLTSLNNDDGHQDPGAIEVYLWDERIAGCVPVMCLVGRRRGLLRTVALSRPWSSAFAVAAPSKDFPIGDHHR